MKTILHQKYIAEAVDIKNIKDFNGITSWQSPSNIAIVKYWGKHDNQLPNNPSISLTLSNAHTETSIQYTAKNNSGISLDFYFDGKSEPDFGKKIERFLIENLTFFPFLNQLHLRVESKNTFPHSSGIASSASSMSALVMCLLDIESTIGTGKRSKDEYLQKASFFSRLASGSAARSVFPYASLWGESESITGSSNEFAIPLENAIHPIFKTYHDSILIISAKTKSVSSRSGHSLMENNPYAKARYSEAEKNTVSLFHAMKKGDLESFIQITETEALQLHALMMTSNPSFILLQPNTLTAIQIVRDFRENTKIPLCFTLDAGPNLHLLYPDAYRNQVEQFIQENLLQFCQSNRWISDRVGNGPSQLV